MFNQNRRCQSLAVDLVKMAKNEFFIAFLRVFKALPLFI